MHYVYIIKIKQNAKLPYYIGYSSDLRRRYYEHQQTYGDIELLYYEAYQNESLARKRESKLKQYGSAWRGLKQRLELTA
jgi:predicted GIY-YIG superfamily endonuclease